MLDAIAKVARLWKLIPFSRIRRPTGMSPVLIFLSSVVGSTVMVSASSSNAQRRPMSFSVSCSVENGLRPLPPLNNAVAFAAEFSQGEVWRREPSSMPVPLPPPP